MTSQGPELKEVKKKRLTKKTDVTSSQPSTPITSAPSSPSLVPTAPPLSQGPPGGVPPPIMNTPTLYKFIGDIKDNKGVVIGYNYLDSVGRGFTFTTKLPDSLVMREEKKEEEDLNDLDEEELKELKAEKKEKRKKLKKLKNVVVSRGSNSINVDTKNMERARGFGDIDKHKVIDLSRVITLVDPNNITFHGNANYFRAIKEFVVKIEEVYKLPTNRAFHMAVCFGVHLNISGPGNANNKVFHFEGKRILLNDLFSSLGFTKLAVDGGNANKEQLKNQIKNSLTVAKVTRAFVYTTHEFLASSEGKSVTPYFQSLNPSLKKSYAFMFACHLNMAKEDGEEYLKAVAIFEEKVKTRAPGRGGNWVDYAKFHLSNSLKVEIKEFSFEMADADIDTNKVNRADFTFNVPSSSSSSSSSSSQSTSSNV